MKITDVSRFGDDEEYLDITFKNNFDDKIEVNINYKKNVISLSCRDVEIEDIKEILAIIDSKKIEIEL